MQAKFVYESIKDILRSKSEEDIMDSIEEFKSKPVTYTIFKCRFFTWSKKSLRNGS